MLRTTTTFALFATVLATALATVPAARAAEARIPISGKTTISAPGTYFVSRAISGAGPLITVSANDVEIDLNGFSLTPTSGAGVYASNVDRLTVRDGFIAGGQSAVRLENVDGARIEDISASGAGSHGLTITGTTQVVIRDVTIRTSVGDGIYFDASALAAPAQVEIARAQILGPSGAGITLVNAGSSLVTDSTINDSGARGITVDRCRAIRIEGNAIRSTGTANIALLDTDGAQILENVLRDASTDGLVVDSASSDNLVSLNQVSSSTGNGIQVGGDRNVFDLNHVGESGGWGLYFNGNAADNVFRANTVRGNTGGACAGGNANFCNLGVNNTSAGDNFAPALM